MCIEKKETHFKSGKSKNIIYNSCRLFRWLWWGWPCYILLRDKTTVKIRGKKKPSRLMRQPQCCRNTHNFFLNWTFILRNIKNRMQEGREFTSNAITEDGTRTDDGIYTRGKSSACFFFSFSLIYVTLLRFDKITINLPMPLSLAITHICIRAGAVVIILIALDSIFACVYIYLLLNRLAR